MFEFEKKLPQKRPVSFTSGWVLKKYLTPTLLFPVKFNVSESIEPKKALLSAGHRISGSEPGKQ